MKNASSSRYLDSEFKDKIFMKIFLDDFPQRIVEFSICYVTLIEGKWKEVIRFDCAHGGLHEHKFYLKHAEIIEISDEITQDLFQKIKAKVEQNWHEYKRKYYENHFI